MTRIFTARSLLPLAAAGLAFSLAACGEREEPTYEADVEDLSGGELIVSEPDPDAVPVDLPETPMTPVPPEGTTSPAPTAAPEAAPAPAE